MHDTLTLRRTPALSAAAARIVDTTRRDWRRPGAARLTPRPPTSTFAASLIADAGETGPRTFASGQAPALSSRANSCSSSANRSASTARRSVMSRA